MSQFKPMPNDPMMSIEIGTFKMTVNQRRLENLSTKKSRHLWAVIGKKIKEETNNGNKKKRR